MLKTQSLKHLLGLSLLIPALTACGGAAPDSAETDPAETDPVEADGTEADGSGTLEVRANGEDFVRQGFVTVDGWTISFDHVYVTLEEVTAYQSDPAFDPTAENEPTAEVSLAWEGPLTVDLAAGDETAEPILVGSQEAPAGRYNALSWKVVPAPEGPAAGYGVMLQGTASKDGQDIAFTLQLDQPLRFVCGDFVGDDRKGILTAGETADLEATFHFDHLFGDGEAAPDDDINTGALGFDPLAALAEDGTLIVDGTDLEQSLSTEDYDKLLSILPSLGHVGEGHCAEMDLS
ncbi:MAG: DUF4382 domain-containing protein [Leptolyngbyaceae cyanobacterium]